MCDTPSRVFLPPEGRSRFRVCIDGRSRSLARSGASPLVHEVGDDGGEEAQQHDGGAGVHHGVQELPWVLGQGEDGLQILQGTQRSPCGAWPSLHTRSGPACPAR